MVMLLLGLGHLMTFSKMCSLGAVSFTMMLSVLSIQPNILVEPLTRFLSGGGGDEDTSFPLPVSMPTLSEGEFAGVILMIMFGAVIGHALPPQMLIVCLSQSVFCASNKAFFDVGGSMMIHMFGAHFGLALSQALGPPKKEGAAETCEPGKASDILALIGTTNPLPSFLTGRKCDPVHVANSILAEGVAIGSLRRLNIHPGAAMILGTVIVAASICGCACSTPRLESKLGFDTCGVGNQNEWPSIAGGLFSIACVALDADAEFLQHDLGPQMVRQFGGTVSTLIISVVSGHDAGLVVKECKDDSAASYHDEVWWHTERY